LLVNASVVCAADKVTLATNWLAQPELGGFYQAVVDGTYAKHGLDVSIKPGGPMVNNRPLLGFGRVDFLIGTNLLQPFDAVKQGIPTKAVAAFFQRDPQCLLAHGDGPWTTWDDLKQAPLMMGNSGRQTFFLWLNAAHGFPKANLRPYNHNLAPFANDTRMVVQGFATAEPKRIEELTGKAPRVFLLADHGWGTYSTLLETRTELIEKRPELVRGLPGGRARSNETVDPVPGLPARRTSRRNANGSAPGGSRYEGRIIFIGSVPTASGSSGISRSPVPTSSARCFPS
jgi:NitT/TauT family transport system substrate-binding protein